MSPLDDHIKDAFVNVQYDVRLIDEDEKMVIKRLLENFVLGDVIYPIGDNSTEKSFYRAIKGTMELDVTEEVAEDG